MKSIGGYFGLEIKEGMHYHKNAILLNTGRNALEYILKANQYSKIYIPFYTCDVLLEPLRKIGIEFEFYNINQQFEPIFDWSRLQKNEAFLYTNYFGLKTKFISDNLKAKNIIIDNAQAFYAKPQNNLDTFYSARKFFGVPDGAYLYVANKMEEVLELDQSYERFAHLLIRHDVSAEKGYPYFQQNDTSLNNQPILEMSTLTKKLLKSIDYSFVAQKRKDNYDYLHSTLGSLNMLDLKRNSDAVPMVYPFFTNDKSLRAKLVQNRIYTPIYWNSALDYMDDTFIESKFVQQIIHLPIDQRMDREELDYIIKIVTS